MTTDTAAQSAQRALIDGTVTATYIGRVQLNESERQTLVIRLIPLRTGRLCVDGVVGRLSLIGEPNGLWGRLNFVNMAVRTDMSGTLQPTNTNVSPPQMVSAAAATTTATSTAATSFDQKLLIDVLPAMPALHVQFSAVPGEVLAGEIIAVQVTLTNTGAVGLGEVWAATEQPRWVLGEDEGELPLSVLKSE